MNHGQEVLTVILELIYYVLQKSNFICNFLSKITKNFIKKSSTNMVFTY